MIIYRCRNKISGKVYIGQTVKTLEERKNEHFNSHLKGKSKFYKALKSYGFDNFDWEIIDTAKTKTELNEREIQYISEYNSIDNGYNMVQGGTGGYNEYAVKANRQKKGESLKDIVSSEMYERAINGRKKGFRNGLINYTFDKIDKELQLKYAKMGSKARTMNGYKHSDETIEKIRQSQIGKVIPEETKKLISKRTKEAMKNVDRELLGKKSVEARKPYWDNKHQQDREMILELKTKGYSVKKICAELDISTPTYYKRFNELRDMGLMYY